MWPLGQNGLSPDSPAWGRPAPGQAGRASQAAGSAGNAGRPTWASPRGRRPGRTPNAPAWRRPGPVSARGRPGGHPSQPTRSWPGPVTLCDVGREAARTSRPRPGLGPARPAWLPFFSFSFLNFCLKNVPREKRNNFHPRTPFSIILDSLESSQRAQQDYAEKHHSPTRYYKNKWGKLKPLFCKPKRYIFCK